MFTTVYESENEYIFIVTDDDNSFEYRFCKVPITEGQLREQYIQNCKHEAELLAQHEITANQPPQEITI